MGFGEITDEFVKEVTFEMTFEIQVEFEHTEIGSGYSRGRETYKQKQTHEIRRRRRRRRKDRSFSVNMPTMVKEKGEKIKSVM